MRETVAVFTCLGALALASCGGGSADKGHPRDAALDVGGATHDSGSAGTTDAGGAEPAASGMADAGGGGGAVDAPAKESRPDASSSDGRPRDVAVSDVRPPGEVGGCSGGQLAGTAACPAAPPAPAAAGKKWDLVFAEEFDGPSYDPAKLTPCFDWNSGDCTDTFNNGRERYLPAQVRVSDGTAKLVAEPLAPPYAASACYQGQCTYKAGLLSTARPKATADSKYLFPFTYGYVEARVKFPAVKGMFTAFWMLPTDPTYNYQTEIDIVEILGYDPTTIWMHYHYNGRTQYHRVNSGNGNNGACAAKDYSRDFVRFGLDWEPTSVAWYIDGVKCGEYAGPAATVESGPMQLILHMMVDNNWERSVSETLDSLTTVSQLEVDYIRIYQQH